MIWNFIISTTMVETWHMAHVYTATLSCEYSSTKILEKFLIGSGLFWTILAYKAHLQTNEPPNFTQTVHILVFPDAIHHSKLYSFRNNSFLRIPGNAARYPVGTRSPQWMKVGERWKVKVDFIIRGISFRKWSFLWNKYCVNRHVVFQQTNSSR